MRNEAGDIVQDHTDNLTDAAEDLKQKAKAAADAAWNITKAKYEEIQDKTVACTQATDRAIRENPYVSLGIAFGLGVVLGAFMLRSKSKCEEND